MAIGPPIMMPTAAFARPASTNVYASPYGTSGASREEEEKKKRKYRQYLTDPTAAMQATGMPALENLPGYFYRSPTGSKYEWVALQEGAAAPKYVTRSTPAAPQQQPSMPTPAPPPRAPLKPPIAPPPPRPTPPPSPAPSKPAAPGPVAPTLTSPTPPPPERPAPETRAPATPTTPGPQAPFEIPHFSYPQYGAATGLAASSKPHDVPDELWDYMQAEDLYQPYVSDYQRAAFRQYSPGDPSMMFETPTYALDPGYRDWEFGNVAPDFGQYASNMRAVAGTTGGPNLRPATEYQYTYQEPGGEAEIRRARKYVADPDTTAYFQTEEFQGYAPEVQQQIRQYTYGRQLTPQQVSQAGRRFASPYYANQILQTEEFAMLPEATQRQIASAYGGLVQQGASQEQFIDAYIDADLERYIASERMLYPERFKNYWEKYGKEGKPWPEPPEKASPESQLYSPVSYDEWRRRRATLPNPGSHPFMRSYPKSGQPVPDTRTNRQKYEEYVEHAAEELMRIGAKEERKKSPYPLRNIIDTPFADTRKNPYPEGTWLHWWFNLGMPQPIEEPR